MDVLSLDEEKKDILEKFRYIVQDVLQPSHDDRFLLRWLRARNFNLENAEKMLREDVKFRKKLGSDTILDTYVMPKGLQSYESTSFLGFDNNNHPVRLFNVGTVDIRGFTRCMSVFEIVEYFVHQLEMDLKKMTENNKKNGLHIETITYIADFTGFRLRDVCDRRVIRCVMNTLKFYQDHYPERLNKIFIINAPQFFSYVFNFFKPILNEVVLSKISIYGREGWKEEVFSIAPEDIIPAFLGGKRYGPGGDPLCSDILNWNKKIPTSLYAADFCSLKTSDPNVREKVIMQRSVFEVEQEVTKPGALLCWEFQTKRYDIKFGLFFMQKTAGKMKNGIEEAEELIPVELTECNDEVERGEFLCKRIGCYILFFDNSYSWLTSKHLMYKIEVKQSPTEELY